MPEEALAVNAGMPIVSGLRSPKEKVCGMVYFGRMLDKMRLHAAGRLPAEYVANLGDAQPRVFDGICCRFLGVAYDDLKARAAEGGTDEELFAWCQAKGRGRDEADLAMFNAFLGKRGWRDEVSERLQTRIREYGLEAYAVECFFDLLDADEGRGIPKAPTPSAP